MRSWTALLAATALTVTLVGCGDDGGDPGAEDSSTASTSPTATSTPSPSAVASATPSEVEEPPSPTEEPSKTVTITIKGDSIEPGGERLEVERDEVVTLKITSDRAGELHVHSKPEQYVEFEAGTSTHELSISAPGVVDVEEHESGHVVVQLEVQ
jgi:hypothetical protein